MNLAQNRFKQALRAGKPLIGLWSSLCSNIAAEAIAGSGFDWTLLDMEHAPNELPIMITQLQALSNSSTVPVVRPAWNDMVLIKRILDAGAHNLLVPYVQTVEEARAAVAATRYPPQGVRGVATIHRSNNFGRVKNYYNDVNDQICVIVQIETPRALANLDAIASVDGADGCFIGPSDLSASMGHRGNPGHPDVRAAIEDAFRRIRKAGKAPGILAPIEADARHWASQGAVVLAVGGDLALLVRQADELAAKFKSETR